MRRQYSSGRFSDLKTKYSRRTVGISNELVSAMKQSKIKCPSGEHDPVVPNGAGNPENHGNVLRRDFYPAMRRVKLHQTRFHDLWHTFFCFLIEKNVQPKQIQGLMGHSTIKETMDIRAFYEGRRQQSSIGKCRIYLRRHYDWSLPSES